MIRYAKKEDATAIHSLNKLSLGYDYPIQQMKQQFTELLDKENHLLLVALDDRQEVVGYLHATSYECLYFPQILNLMALAVRKDFQGQGYGKELMQFLKKEGRKLGYGGVRINTGIYREVAHHFYHSLGCIEKKEQKRFYWEF